MVSANIYKTEPLSKRQERAIGDGLDLLGQYIGGITVRREYVTKLPNKNGVVSPARVRYAQFDSSRPLHLFVAPIVDELDGALGVSYVGSGVSWVGIRTPLQLLASTTAHEVTHSLGFVLAGSPQGSKVTDGHCNDETCIMYASVKADNSRQFESEDGLLRSTQTTQLEDYCLPCKVDIRDMATEHLQKLGLARWSQGVTTHDATEW